MIVLPGQSRHAIVTGAASGIGRMTTTLLQARGWKVAGFDLRPTPGDLSFEVDVTDPRACDEAVRLTIESWGGIDLLVTAAGYDERCPVDEITDEQWSRMLRMHLGGTANMCASTLPHLSSGIGAIVAVASELGISGSAENVHYATAKGAVIGFIKALAAERAGTGLAINVVAPGPTDTPLLEPTSPWRDPAYLASLPLGRLVQPSEIAYTILFLAEAGDMFCGEVISPNSGAVI